MKIFKLMIFILAAMALPASCSKDISEPQNGGTVICTIGVEGEGFSVEAKSILGQDSELSPFINDSGYQLLVFNRRANILESVVTASSLKDKLEVTLNSADTYDMFVIGNMWFCGRNGGKYSYGDYFSAVGKYPHNASDMQDTEFLPCYRFDGEYLTGTSFRSESFAEVAGFGIPYSGSVLGVEASGSPDVTVPVERLFSKVTLRVDHSGLSGNLETDPFVNSSIHLRQVNCKVHPFIGGISALAGDILDSAEDYELHPANGREETFVFYVPENYGGKAGAGTVPDRKLPSAVGERSGLVTFLEFEGVLDPETGGGYGGVMKYQFCLGENNTDDYNVVRNRNHNVTLGFRTSTLFDGPEWKFDCVNGMVDIRELGYSEDRYGARRLKSEGQVIALRSSNDSRNKKALYLFFNHSGGRENEFSSYIDEYGDGYVPSDVSRSAVRVSCQDMSRDAIEWAFDPSSGRLEFWCVNPSAFEPGHEYPLTVTLFPGGTSHTAVIRTCEDMTADADLDDFYVAQKRTVSLKGFCGNASVRVLSSDVKDAVSLTNKEGGLRFIDGEAVSADRSSLDFYAYKPVNNMKVAVSSDDSFNDGEEITLNFSIFLPERKAEPLGLLPIDGTPVSVVCEYYDKNGEKPVFDPQVYHQLLDLDCTLNQQASQWLGIDDRGDNTSPGVFIRRLKMDNGSSLKDYISIVGSLGNLLINSRDRTLYPSPLELAAGTVFPEFAGEWSSGSEMTSDYFNHWDSSWNWTDWSEVDNGCITDKWPEIINDISVNPAGCSFERTWTESFVMGKDAGITEDYISAKMQGSASGENLRLFWCYSPGDYKDGISDTRGALAPFGKQSVSISVTNMHSGDKYTFSSPQFNLKYGIVRFSSYTFYYENEEKSKSYVAAPTVLAWILYEVSMNRSFNPLSGVIRIPVPLDAASSSLISFSCPAGVDPYLGEPYVEYEHNLTGALVEVPASFSAWRMNSYPYTDEFSSYLSQCWNRELVDYYINSSWPLPNRYSFSSNGKKSSEILGEWFNVREMSNFIRFQFDYRSIDDDLLSKGYIFIED